MYLCAYIYRDTHTKITLLFSNFKNIISLRPSQPGQLSEIWPKTFAIFLCKSLLICYINPYKLDKFFLCFFYYLFAISYVNLNEC